MRDQKKIYNYLEKKRFMVYKKEKEKWGNGRKWKRTL